MPNLRVRGCEIAVEMLGPDPESTATTPFVWGHGLTSSRAAEDVHPLVDLGRLAQSRPVLRYDARGHGESGSLTSPSDGDWAELAKDQLALIDHFGFGDVMLGGASMGTATALHAALALGERVRKLVLVIPPTGWESRAAQVDLYEQMAAIVETKGSEPLVAGLRLTAPPEPFTDDEEFLARRIDTLRSTPPERLAAVFRGAAVADLPPPESIAGIEAPTLVLAWSGDPGHPVSTAERLGEIMPMCDVEIASTRAELDEWTTRCTAFLADG